jgi:CBS domain-containing protein
MEQQDIRELRVAEISHSEWPTLGPEETVEAAIKLFAESGISGAPVVEDGRLVGIVTASSRWGVGTSTAKKRSRAPALPSTR